MTEVRGFFSYAASLIIPIVCPSPNPAKMLKTGPATVAVTAISPNPRLVIATSAVISPKQLPQATIVRASKESGRCVTKPKVCNKSMITFDEN